MIQTNRYYKEKWMKNNKIGGLWGRWWIDSQPFYPKYSDQQIANPENDTDWMGPLRELDFKPNIIYQLSAEVIIPNIWFLEIILNRTEYFSRINDMERFSGVSISKQKIKASTLGRSKSDFLPII